MNTNIKIISRFRLCTCIIFSVICIETFGLNIDLFMPRADDICKRTVVRIERIRCDSVNHIIDVRNAVEAGEEIIKYYLPNSNDTINDLIMSTSLKEITYLKKIDGRLVATECFKPGQHTKYINYIPEIVFNKSDSNFLSEGNQNMLVSYSESGQWQSEVFDNWKIIMSDNDTIDNVVLSSVTISGQSVFENIDSIPEFNFITQRKSFYAVGYRYPIVDLIQSRATYKNEIVDSYNKCSIYEPYAQRIEIINDVENIHIRNDIEQRLQNRYSAIKSFSRSKNTDYDENVNVNDNNDLLFNYDPDTKILTILFGEQENYLLNLCDTSGKILNTIKGDNFEKEKYTFNLQNYPSGEYIIYAIGKQTTEVYRFISR